MNGIPSPAQRTFVALLLVVLGGLGLRLLGVGFLLPEMTEPDAAVYSAQVQYFQDGSIAAESDRQYTFYPFLVAQLAVALQPPRAYDSPARSLEEHLERAAAPRQRLRLAVALLSLLAIPATWLLARRFLDRTFAFVATVFMAASFLAIWFAQEARPHAASSAFAAWAVVAALALRAVGGWSRFLAAGLAAGLAVGSLQSGLAVLPPIALALFLRWRAKEQTATTMLAGAGFVLAVMGSLIAAFYPFLFESTPSGGIQKDATNLRLSGHIIDLTLFDGRGFATLARTFRDYEPVVGVLAITGILLGVQALWTRGKSRSRLQRDQAWIALAYVIPYVIAIGLYARTYQRFVLPLVPFACVLAAYALHRFVSFARGRGRAAGIVALAAASVPILGQVFAAWSLVRARAAQSTVDMAARWIEANVPNEARISFLPMFELPLNYSLEARSANERALASSQFLWSRYLRDLPGGGSETRSWNLRAFDLTDPAVRQQVSAYPDPYLRGQSADFVVLHVFGNPWRVVPCALRESARRLGKLAVRITPDAVDRGSDIEFVHQDDDFPETSSWFFRAMGLARVGPVVEIYDLR